MTDAHSILRQSLIYGAGRFASVFLGVFVLGITTRLLGPEQFGIYGTALAYLQLFGILMDFGLTVTGVDLMARAPSAEYRARLMGALVSLRAMLSTGITVLAFLILRWFAYPGETRRAIYIASLLFILYSFQQLFTSAYQFSQRTLPIVRAELFGRIITLVGLGVVALANGGVGGVLVAGIAGNAIAAVLLGAGTRELLRWRFNWDAHLWREALSTSWPMAVSIAFNLIYFKADTIILAMYAPSEVVGLYVAPYKILEVLISFPPLLLGMVLPQWTRSVEERKMTEFSAWFEWAFDTMALLIFPMVAGTLAVATPLMELISGASFQRSGSILQILIIAVGVIFFSQVFGYAIVALGKQKKMIPAYAVAAALSILAYLTTIPRYGMLGAAWTTVGIEFFILLLSAIVIINTTRITIKVKNLSLYIFGSVIMYGGIMIFRDVIHILLLIAIGGSIYCILLFLFGVIKTSQIKEIIGLSPHTLDA